MHETNHNKRETTLVCDICGKECAGNRSLSAHKRWHDKDAREKASETLKEVWKDESLRKRQSKIMKRIGNDSAVADKKSRTLKEYWSDEERRKKNREVQIEAWKDPELRKMSSDRAKEQWLNNGERMASAIRKGHAESGFSEKMSEIMKQRWSDDEMRNRMSKLKKEQWEDEEWRRKTTEAVRKGHSSEEYRKGQSERARLQWKNTDSRRKQLESLREFVSSDWGDEARAFYGSREGALGIIEGFDHKPTITELKDYLHLWTSTVGRTINAYGLRDMVSYKPLHSNAELEVLEFVRSLGFEAYSDRTVLDGKELDIWVPSKNVALEYNGSYWHSDIFKSRRDHLEKTIACEEKGIRLIHIWEWEWSNKREIVESIIKSALGVDERIFARNCEVRYMEQAESRDFINENHIQGNINAKVSIGLFMDDSPVAVMTFGRPRFNHDCEWELLRFCCRLGTNVIGGESRLFKHAVKDYEMTSIQSFCNRSKFLGTGYEKIGFSHVRDTDPGYVWVRPDDGDVLTRYRTQMKHENSVMKANGYLKVFDCGNKVYEYR